MSAIAPAPARASWLLLLVALLTAYGSLYPFDITTAEAAAAWQRFLAQRTLATSRGDMIGNIALFLPFGLVGGWAAQSSARPWLCALLLFAASCGWAFALQAAQIVVPGRHPALADVFWNSVGVLLGLLLARIGSGVSGIEIRGAMHPIVIAALLVLWLSVELLPFVPTLDWQSIKNSLKPLVFTAEFSLPRFAMHCAGALIAGRVLSEIGVRPLWLALGLALLAVSFAKLFVVGLQLSFSMVLGLASAWLAWLALARLPRAYADGAVIALLLAAYLLNALKPYVITDGASAFNWKPFYGQLQGSMLANIGAMVNNLFFYTAALALVREHTPRLLLAGALLLALVFATEQAQTRILGRHGDVTELLWVLLTLLLLTRVPRRRKSAANLP